MSDYLDALISIQRNAETGNLEQAFVDCDRVIASQPDNAEALHLSGYILLLKDKPKDAISRILMAISEQQDNFVYHATLAFAYRAAGNERESHASYRRALDLQPNDQDTLVSLAEIGSVKGVNPDRIDAAAGTSSKIIGYLIASSMTYSARAIAINPDHAGAVEIDSFLQHHLQTNIIKILDDAVPNAIGRGKPKVIYPLRVIGRMGHLIVEPFLLKCLFDPTEYDIVILTPPRAEAVSVPVYDISMRQTFPLELAGGNPALELWGASSGIHTIGDTTYVAQRVNDLGGRVLRNMTGRELPHRFSLNEDERTQGLRLRREMGIPANAPIVTLYVREKGFFPNLAYHSIRNANIENYISAIKYLVNEGFYVVRIGDDKMHPLPDLGPQVTDAPFHPAYNQYVEPYFVSESTFMLKTTSGPDSLSMAFGIPGLLTNAYWQPWAGTTKNDLCIPKKYYSHRYQRVLTMSEATLDKDLLFSGDATDFAARHIELLENTEQEILLATKEMVARLRGEYRENASYAARFRDLCRRIHADCENDIYSHSNLDADYFGAYLSGLNISDAFCALNPDFLR